MAAPDKITELVQRFTDNQAAYLGPGYNEAQVRREFVDPLFRALGWDVDNEQGHAEAYKDVIHEDAIRIGGATKAPDYCFRIGGVRKFFLEAKRPAVRLKDDPESAYQLRRYAWSAKLPLSILTDFEEFAVYDCRIKPERTDSAATARVLYLTYLDYAARWDELAGYFAKEAVLKGAFDRFAESNRHKRGTTEVDAAFLSEIQGWREVLARHLALRNPELSQRQLNFAVQTTIDRIVFLRMGEDRGLEDYGQLQSLLNGERAYPRLMALCQKADDRYNSGLFHFRAEKGRPDPPDDLTPRLTVDDKPLKEIIGRLYYPDSPYEFSVLPADILGQVYEQFLGQVIRLTPGHQAKVEDKPEVKKAGGVYYTPTYIVDYLVNQTVGKLLARKSPRQAGGLRVLDPACGSGSFLLGAYQYLLDWHQNAYLHDGPATWAKGRAPRLVRVRNGDWKLTTAERKRILLSHVYGVDIDPQAVEVTKLSLLLKVLESENQQTLWQQLELLHERALPDLSNNIKCGNSLIGPDFYEGQQLELFGEDERYQINAFAWQAEFPEVMSGGGFSAIISNPPWGASFTGGELAYLRQHYPEVIARMVDSYLYFMAQGMRLGADEAALGFIVPGTLLNQVDARLLRELLLKRGLSAVVNLGQGVFGPKVQNTAALIVCAETGDGGGLTVKDLSATPPAERGAALTQLAGTARRRWEALVRGDPHCTFFVGGLAAGAIVARLRRKFAPLRSILSAGIHRGVSPDVAAAHVVTPETAAALGLEPELLRPSVSGAQVKRYHDWTADQLLLYATKATPISAFPKAQQYLAQFRSLNTCPEVAARKHPYWALHRARDPGIFAAPKFIGLTTAKTIELIYDEDQSVYVTDAMYVFSLQEPHDALAVLAILQSRLFHFLYQVANQGDTRVIPQVKASKLERLPFPSPLAASSAGQLGGHAKTLQALHRRLAAARTPHERTVLQRQIEATDRAIDRLVYELYGLTEHEVSIVEGETR